MYGFVPSEPTPSDVIELEGAFTPDDLARAPGDASMRAEKEALLDSCRYRPPRTFELSNRRIDPAIICALRLTLLTAHDLEQRCEGNWNRPLAHAPVSAENEREVALALRGRLEGMLESCASRAAEEEEEEEEAELDPHGYDVACAIQLRANRHRMLGACIARLDDFLSSAASTDSSSACIEGEGGVLGRELRG